MLRRKVNRLTLLCLVSLLKLKRAGVFLINQRGHPFSLVIQEDARLNVWPLTAEPLTSNPYGAALSLRYFQLPSHLTVATMQDCSLVVETCALFQRSMGFQASSTLSTLAASTWENEPEPLRCCEPGGCHPLNAGELCNQHYRVVRQLGWGLCSIIWLVMKKPVWIWLCVAFTFIYFSSLETNVGRLWRSGLVGGLTRGWDKLGRILVLHDRNTQFRGHYHIYQFLD
jgi:hypothetical protein